MDSLFQFSSHFSLMHLLFFFLAIAFVGVRSRQDCNSTSVCLIHRRPIQSLRLNSDVGKVTCAYAGVDGYQFWSFVRWYRVGKTLEPIPTCLSSRTARPCRENNALVFRRASRAMLGPYVCRLYEADKNTVVVDELRVDVREKADIRKWRDNTGRPCRVTSPSRVHVGQEPVHVDCHLHAEGLERNWTLIWEQLDPLSFTWQAVDSNYQESKSHSKSRLLLRTTGDLYRCVVFTREGMPAGWSYTRAYEDKKPGDDVRSAHSCTLVNFSSSDLESYRNSKEPLIRIKCGLTLSRAAVKQNWKPIWYWNNSTRRVDAKSGGPPWQEDLALWRSSTEVWTEIFVPVSFIESRRSRLRFTCRATNRDATISRIIREAHIEDVIRK